MPSLFRLFGYVIFFWSNEGAPLEPVHVHVAKGVPNASATKIWITEAGGCIVANNNSKIPARTLSAIVDVLGLLVVLHVCLSQTLHSMSESVHLHHLFLCSHLAISLLCLFLLQGQLQNLQELVSL